MGRKQKSGWITEIYLFLMLVVFPLLVVNSYEDLVFKKWALFLYASAAFIVGSGVCFLCGINKKASQIRNCSRRAKLMTFAQRWLPTDYFAVIYLICAFISYGMAVDKDTGLWGVDTWYMGLVAQVLFVGIYFAISAGYTDRCYIKAPAAVTGVCISIMVILQRFGINVFHLYDDFGDDVKLNFVATLGQVTWASGYISILLIAGMGIYFMAESMKTKIVLAFCIGIGYAAELVLNCDSGVIAILVAWMIMLWLAFESRQRMLALLETVFIALAVTAGMGLLERMFAGHMIPIDELYLHLAQSKVVYVLLLMVGLIYLSVRKNVLFTGRRKRMVLLLKIGYILTIILAIITVAVLFVLHEKNYFNGSPTENYFRFTIWWGNSRGFIWRTGAAVFADFTWLRKLFGCGPDCFTPYAYELMGDAINEFWHNQIVPNVHNEWFNALINYGITGGIAYLGIFVSAAYGFMKKAVRMQEKQAPLLFGTGLAAAGYIAHNVLCYQQMIGTSLIFVLLGVGAALSRRMKDI